MSNVVAGLGLENSGEAPPATAPETFDVVVVGSGAGGMTAATVAAKAGLAVVLLEKTEYFGGTTAYSGGGVWIPNNPYQSALEIQDTSEKAGQYVRAVLGNYYDAEKATAFVKHAPEMLAYMVENTRVEFISIGNSDYEPQLGGANFGRTLLSPAFEAASLGPNLKRLRPSLPQLSIFGTMQFGITDIAQIMDVHRSLSGFLYSGKLFAKFLLDRVRYGKGARLANGNALAGRLLQSAMEAGVTLWNNAPAVELIADGSSVCGVVVDRGGALTQIRARKGVILATGGFGANAKMRAEHIPMADAGWSLQPEGNVGDGINMGVAVGGVFKTDNEANGIWVPMSSMVKGGKRISYPHLFFDRHSPGTLVVDKSGRRFINESTHYQAFCNTMHAANISSAYLIADHPAQRKYGMGLARPAPNPIAPFVRNGYLIKADTIGELARKLGIDERTLEETIAKFNTHAAVGADPDFHRGLDAYSAGMGDPNHKPNPCLAPLTRAPFYAIELRPGDLSTLCGLDTNAHAQVLSRDGRVIEGLYAVGLDQNSMFRGTYPGGGASLGPAMTFGYVAARHIAAKSSAGAVREGRDESGPLSATAT